MRDIHNQTYYELLEVDPSASQEEILKAYNRARATYGHNSPALYSLFNKEEAQELLRLIDEAYAVLSNQFKRKQYDTQKTAFINNVSPDLAIPSVGALPGFEDEGISTHTPTPAPTLTPTPARQTVNVGTGTTRFGSYKIDPLFEEEIKSTEVYSGDVIQKIRLYKNITLDQISDVTKISRPYLLAIEANNFSSLPAPVFVRGFLVQLSKILGLDANKVIGSFLKLAQNGSPR